MPLGTWLIVRQNPEVFLHAPFLLSSVAAGLPLIPGKASHVSASRP